MNKLLVFLSLILISTAMLYGKNIRIVPGAPAADVVIQERQAQIEALMTINDLTLIEATLVNLLQEASSENVPAELKIQISNIVGQFIVDMDTALKTLK